MASFPTQAIDVAKASIRYKEPYLSQALNRKLAGFPIGIYRGFTPVVTGVDTMELRVDATSGDSIGIGEDTGGYSIHVREDTDIVLDFTGQPLGDFPLLVVLEVGYTPAPSGTTSAEIKTIAPGAFVANKQVKICEVDKTASLVVDVTVPTNRQEPFAFSGQTAGFMPGTGFPQGGAIEELQRAALNTQEVETARTNTNSATTYADLQSRLDTEFSGAGIAGLLPKVGKQIRGKLYPDFAPLEPGWSGSGSTVNVSADFASQIGLPGTDIPPSVARTDVGVAISSPDNWVDLYTLANDELIDEEGNRIHGRLSFNPVEGAVTFNLTDDGDIVAGGFVFAQFSDTVQGNGSDVANEVEVGDIIEAPDGTFVIVSAVDGGLQQLTLTAPYSSVTARIVGPERRRFELEFNRIIVAGNIAIENPVSIPRPPASTISFRAAYHRRFTLDELPAVSAEAELQRSQAAGRSPDATTTVAGKVLLAANLGTTSSTVVQADDERVGAIRVDTETATAGSLVSPTDWKTSLKIIQGANMTITVTEEANHVEIAFAAATGGPAGPSPATTVSPQDAAAGSVGASLLYARADHQHPFSAEYTIDWELLGNDRLASGISLPSPGSIPTWTNVFSVGFTTSANEKVFVTVDSFPAEDAGFRFAVDGAFAETEGVRIGGADGILPSPTNGGTYLERSYSTFIGPLTAAAHTLTFEISADSTSRGPSILWNARPIGGAYQMRVWALRQQGA